MRLMTMMIVLAASFAGSDAMASNPNCPVEANAALIQANKEALGRKVKDPYSAVYTNTVVSCKSGVPIVCGMVNLKNGYGAYIGSQRWIGALYDAFTEQSLSYNFQKFWDRLCE